MSDHTPYLRELEDLRWAILGDATTDEWGLWEAVALGRSMMPPMLDRATKDEATSNLLEAMLQEGIISFLERQLTSEGNLWGRRSPLSTAEAIEELRSDWWRTEPPGVVHDDRSVWLVATPSGARQFEQVATLGLDVVKNRHN